MKALLGKAFVAGLVVAAWTVALLAGPARADGLAEGWVTTTGVDQGPCPASNPCRTIGYALRRVAHVGTVRVGPGRFCENLIIPEAQRVTG